MAKKETNAVAVRTSNPKDLPVGILTRCLFNMSIGELAEEISMNKGGKWDAVYSER